MTDDLLREATRALREESAGEDRGARFTRARVLNTLHGNTRKRKLRLAFVVPLAAILVGSSAWAGMSGRLPPLLTQALAVVGLVPASSVAPASSGPTRGPISGSGAATSAPHALAPSTELAPRPPEQNPTAPSAASEASASPELLERGDARRSAAATDGAPEGPPVALEPAAREYQRAHRLHFEARDYGAALAAWDAYLAAAPRGRFAPEARYNRALCLIRLGSLAAGRQALEPFARGAYGGYRQREASELLGALADSADEP
jgi:hypothetical protein